MPKDNTAPKKEMNIFLRILLGFVRIILSIVLCVTLLITALVVDLQILTSKNTLSTVIEQLFTAPVATGARLSAAPASDASTSQLTDMIYDLLTQNSEGDIPFTKEELNNFLEQSTLPEFVADKGAGFIEDFISGTTNTTITKEDVSQLLEDNRQLIEEFFEVEITDEAIDEIVNQVEDLEIDKVFRDQIVGEVDKTEIAPGVSVRDALDVVNEIASVSTLLICIGVDLFLALLLFFANRLRFPGTMVSVGVPMLIMGLILAAPLLIVQSVPELFAAMEPTIGGIVMSLAGALAPVHYGMPILGLLLIIGAIVVKCLTRKKPQIIIDAAADTEAAPDAE